ncbi:unnamed protein product [Symbiodinium microadriaticum]|nr:unnamed protein product [Symbiodinium microadriaticum]
MWTGSASKKGFSRGCSNRGLRSFSLRIQRVEDPPQPRLTPHPPRVQPGAMDPEATRVPCSRASLRSSQHRDAAGGPVLQAEAFKLPRSTAASLEGHVKEIRANSKLIAADLQNAHQEAKNKIQKTLAGGVLAPGLEEVQLHVTFEEGSLGLNLDLADGQVLKVTPGGQAEQLGLRVQDARQSGESADRLLAVRGCSLPATSDPSFQEAAKKQLSLAKQRPANDSVNMTFLRIVQSEGQGKKNQEDSQQLCQAQAKIHELQAVLLSSPDWTLHCDLVHLRLLFRVVACGFFHRVGSPSTSNTFRRLMFSNEKFLPARATVRPIEQADCLRCKSV